MAELTEINKVLQAAGLDVQAVLEVLLSPAVKERLLAITQSAFDRWGFVALAFLWTATRSLAKTGWPQLSRKSPKRCLSRHPLSRLNLRRVTF